MNWTLKFATLATGGIRLIGARRGAGKNLTGKEIPSHILDYCCTDVQGVVTDEDARRVLRERSGGKPEFRITENISTPVVRSIAVTDEYRVDMRHYAWPEPDVWEEYEPGVLAKIQATADAGRSAYVITSPRKGDVCGTVRIWRDGGTYHAAAEFSHAWDEPRDLLDTLGVTEDQIEAQLDGFHEVCPFVDGSPGVNVVGSVTSKSFRKLITEVSKLRDSLDAENREAWNALVLSYMDEKTAIERRLIECDSVYQQLSGLNDKQARSLASSFIYSMGLDGAMKLKKFIEDNQRKAAEENGTDAVGA